MRRLKGVIALLIQLGGRLHGCHHFEGPPFEHPQSCRSAITKQRPYIVVVTDLPEFSIVDSKLYRPTINDRFKGNLSASILFGALPIVMVRHRKLDLLSSLIMLAGFNDDLP